MEECDHERIPTGSMKELKEALKRHGLETGSTEEATRAWRSHGSIRRHVTEEEFIDRPSLAEEDL